DKGDTMSIQKVTIVGTGSVGSALARNFLRHGIAVQFAARDVAKAREAAAPLGERASVVETRSLQGGIEALFLAVPANAAGSVLEEASGLAAGTIVVDCTNPLKWDEGPVHTPPPE